MALKNGDACKQLQRSNLIKHRLCQKYDSTKRRFMKHKYKDKIVFLTNQNRQYWHENRRFVEYNDFCVVTHVFSPDLRIYALCSANFGQEAEIIPEFGDFSRLFNVTLTFLIISFIQICLKSCPGTRRKYLFIVIRITNMLPVIAMPNVSAIVLLVTLHLVGSLTVDRCNVTFRLPFS